MQQSLVVAWNKLRALVQRSAREADMDEEMRLHVDMEAADLRQAGVPADEALRRARATFGGIERQKDDARDAVGVRLFDDLAQDFRYGARQLRASPAFTVATLLTLALGVGATTTMYTIEHTVATFGVDIADPGTLVHVAQGTIGGCLSCWRIAKGNYMTLRDESRTLSDVTLIAGWNPILRGSEHTEIVNGARVTPAFFELLGIHAMLGRTIVRADSTPDRENVVVVSETFWQTKLGRDSAIVGKTIVLDAAPRTVIGVVAQRFVFPQGALVWTPRILGPVDAADRSWTNDNAIARLRPGVTLAQARAELATIGAQVAASYPAAMRRWSFGAETFMTWQSPTSADDIPLFIAVGMVLGVACINLAGLLLARLTARRKEIAIRAAMGAGRTRIARQLLTETLLLTVASGTLGAAVAAGAIHFVRDAMPSFVVEYLPNWRNMRLDLAALVVAIGTGALTGIALGLWPALRFSRPSLVEELKDGARSATASGRVSRMRHALVVFEIAFAIMLLSAAGLLARSVRNMHAVRSGFRADHVLTFRVDAPARAAGDSTPVDSLRWERLAARLDALPDVARASAVYGIPYSRSASTNGFTIEGRAANSPLRGSAVQMVPAGVDYFATLEIPMLRGRAFTATDRSGAPRVAIIDEAIADKFFPTEDPIGHSLVIDSIPWQIVGVAGKTRYGARNRVISQSPGEIYRPMAQWPWRFTQFVVRTHGEPLQSAPEAMRVVRNFDRDLAVTRVTTLESVVRDDLAPDQVFAGSMVVLAVAAVLISAIGLYGVISYGVAQRMREFGIRRALGAESTALLSLVLGQGARLAATGAALGLVGALAATRILRAVLFGVSPTDPLTLAAVVAAMCAVGVAAACVPARRATRVDPMVSLREE
jgi:predicted permease